MLKDMRQESSEEIKLPVLGRNNRRGKAGSMHHGETPAKAATAAAGDGQPISRQADGPPSSSVELGTSRGLLLGRSKGRAKGTSGPLAELDAWSRQHMPAADAVKGEREESPPPPLRPPGTHKWRIFLLPQRWSRTSPGLWSDWWRSSIRSCGSANSGWTT